MPEKNINYVLCFKIPLFLILLLDYQLLSDLQKNVTYRTGALKWINNSR